MLLLLACTGSQTLDSSLELGEPGTFELAFEHDGLDRSALVHVPTSWQAGGGILLNFHGYGGSSLGHLHTADLREQAEAEAFILVYPQGSELEGSPHWNAALPGGDNKSEADDFGFTERLLGAIGDSYAHDPERVHAIGYSNGGMFSFALACHTELVRGVGSVSGTMLDPESCEPQGPTLVLTWHGTEDSVLPYEGDDETLGIEEVVGWWAEHNGLGAAETSSEGPITRFAHPGEAPVHHHRVEGGEHVWFDESFQGQSLDEGIWGFFEG